MSNNAFKAEKFTDRIRQIHLLLQEEAKEIAGEVQGHA